ncbi:protein stum homolog [Indicator indicator]|uniref:protein stum homolog n=1 Tax=Indicator indicator TaxID=1002788 RepID=UPI0023DE81B2|nr:protein stum homolog [Indicator indicator]
MDPLPKDGESAAAGEPSRGAAPSSGVVVQVREKKGPLRAAIPYMPFPVAVICLFLNTFVPGLGTFVSAFTVLCGARTDLPDRHMCCVFWLNIAAALIQILTAIVMVGWIMSIFWGMDMVILAKHHQNPGLDTLRPSSPNCAARWVTAPKLPGAGGKSRTGDTQAPPSLPLRRLSRGSIATYRPPGEAPRTAAAWGARLESTVPPQRRAWCVAAKEQGDFQSSRIPALSHTSPSQRG